MTLYFSLFLSRPPRQSPAVSANNIRSFWLSNTGTASRRLLAGSGGVRVDVRRPAMVAVIAVCPLSRCRPRPCCRCSAQVHAHIATPQDRQRNFTTILPLARATPVAPSWCRLCCPALPFPPPESSPWLPLYACPPTPALTPGYHIPSVILPSLKSTPTPPHTRETHLNVR